MREILPTPHLLTCAQRAESLARTLVSWKGSDWGQMPRVHFDEEPEEPWEEWGKPARVARASRAFAQMLRVALSTGGETGDWLLFLEDDLEFHPRIGSLLVEWGPLRDERCVLASLFNPSLPADPLWCALPRAFVASAKNFLGAQALLIRRGAAREALGRWDQVQGVTSQRLARLLSGAGPIWVHRPALVQHVAKDSSWGARVQKALDFDPDWRPEQEAAGV